MNMAFGGTWQICSGTLPRICSGSARVSGCVMMASQPAWQHGDTRIDMRPQRQTDRTTCMQRRTHIHWHTRTHTYPYTHDKTYTPVGVGTTRVIADWAILPVLCISHYRLCYPASPSAQ